MIEIVCCKMTPMQEILYNHFIHSKAAKQALTGKQTKVLGAILGAGGEGRGLHARARPWGLPARRAAPAALTRSPCRRAAALKKLCNHPRLIYEMFLKGKAARARERHALATPSSASARRVLDREPGRR